MLSSSEIAKLRADAVMALPETAEIQRKTRVSDGAGGFTETWSTVATVACRVTPQARLPQEQAIAAKLTSVSGWIITLPAITDVRSTDRIVVGNRTFEVVEVQARSWEFLRRVICTEVT